MRLHPFELIQQESGIQVRYRYDWHIGAMPERYTYDKTGQKQSLNELALDLAPGEYGRAVCNGRFRDWDNHMAIYLRWCMEHDLMGEEFLAEYGEVAEKVKADPASVDLRAFIREELDGCLFSVLFNQQGRAFAGYYYTCLFE